VSPFVVTTCDPAWFVLMSTVERIDFCSGTFDAQRTKAQAANRSATTTPSTDARSG